MKIDNLAARIETIAPLTMQEPWDHSGWQLRLTDGEIHSVLIALEINEQVIAMIEAAVFELNSGLF